MLISRGNTKVGKLPSFSLPVLSTCPGKTPFCDRFCYGLRGRFVSERIKQINEQRYEASLRDDFVDRITLEILKADVAGFRLHVVGDFYAVAYIDKWIEIARRLPAVAFFGSTRSWRSVYLRDRLEAFRDLPNVFMRASVDNTHRDMPGKGWRLWSVEGKGVPCPHDSGLVTSCGSCKRCWTIKDFDMSLNLRWGSRSEYLTPNLIT